MTEDLHFWKKLNKSLKNNDNSFDDLLDSLSKREEEYEELQQQLNNCVRDLILLNAMLILKTEDVDEED